MISFILAVVFSLSVFTWADTFTKDTTFNYINSSGITYPVDLCGASCPSVSGCSLVGLYRVSKGGEASYNCPTSQATVTQTCKTANSTCRIYCRYTCQSEGVCSSYSAECESAGGTFTGTTVSDNGQDCCRGSCNVCGSKAMKSMYQAKTKICCEAGLAPPDSNQTCSTVSLPTSGCGMVWSSYGDFTSGGWSCSDPSSSWEAGSRFSQCFPPNSSGGNGSSSGAGSSGSSSGNGDYGDCKECPWLDSILDTLTAQKSIVSDIYACVTNPFLCSMSQSDSLPGWVREKLDNIINFDSVHKNISDTIKTLTKHLLATDSALLSNDTTTRITITNAALTVDSSVTAAADSVTRWLNYIADSLHLSTRYLINHLDSIRSTLHSDILDSVVKYQKIALEDFDSAFYGSNSGFKKIDNLIDSAVKYFQEGFRHDSIYYANYGDSLGAIHGAIENLSGSIEGVGDKILYGLGYGDTASSTLRDDLRGYLTGTAVDTHGVNYGSNWVANGERMGDSIVNSLGWGGIRNMNIDSVYSHALDGSRIDSVSQSIDDSLSGVAANLNDSLAVRTDSLKRQLPTVLDSMADSLVIWAPFSDFDSIIYSTIGAHIPNRSDCPEDCQKWTVSIPIIGLYSYTVDFGLCLGRATFGGLSVLGFLKLLIRVIVAYVCIMTAYKVLVRMI